MGVDFHIRFANHLATPLVSLAVDLHTTLKTSPHTAEWSARLAGDRLSTSADREHHGHRYCRSGGNGHQSPVDANCKNLRHALR